MSKRLMGRLEEGSDGSFPGLRREITRACFHAWGKWWVRRTALKIWARKEIRSLGKMLQCPVRDTVRASSLADLETPDGCVNLVRGS